MSVINLQSQQRMYQEALIIGSRMIYADVTIQMFSIENRWAADFWFSETNWCVKENPWFEGYIERGPLILLRSLKRSRDYLLAPAAGEFRNSRNRRVSLKHFVEQHSNVIEPLKKIGVYWLSVNIKGNIYNQILYFSSHLNSNLSLLENRLCSSSDNINYTKYNFQRYYVTQFYIGCFTVMDSVNNMAISTCNYYFGAQANSKSIASDAYIRACAIAYSLNTTKFDWSAPQL